MTLVDNTEITAQEIAKSGLDNLPAGYQKTVGFFAWDFFIAIGEILHQIYKKIIYIAKCLEDPSNMDYEDLCKYTYYTRNIEAKKATGSSGFLTVTNGEGLINKGTIFETRDGIKFQAIEEKQVHTNDVFEVESVDKGKKTNVVKNSIVVIPTTIQGIVSVTNNEAFVNGYDDESKESLLNRYYEDLQKPIISGNIYHYRKLALEVIGVSKAIVKPLWNGDNTVKVVIIDSNKKIPSLDLIKSVQNHIDPYVLDEKGAKIGWGCGNGAAPIGAYCTVVGADALNLSVSFDVILKNGADLDSTKKIVFNAIEEYFSQIALDENVNYVSYAKIGVAIMNCENVLDYKNLKLNDDINNILIINNNVISQIPVLENLTVNEV